MQIDSGELKSSDFLFSNGSKSLALNFDNNWVFGGKTGFRVIEEDNGYRAVGEQRGFLIMGGS